MLLNRIFNDRGGWILAGMIALFLATSGCDLPERYQRNIRLTKPFGPGLQFSVVTHNGSITVVGARSRTCEVSATITGRGPTREDARKVAESINVSLVSRGQGLIAEIDKPSMLEQRYYSVDYHIQLPKDTSLAFQTHNGSISVENILGDIRISTHNGGVNCYGVSGRIHAMTHNGSVEIHYADSALDPMDTMVSTHNGSIDIKAPERLSTMLSASTHNGKIKVNRQITVSGAIDKNNLNGRIGSGKGDMRLKTHNGAITVK